MRHALILACIVLAATPVAAATLQCRSVNGNVTCAGSGAVACQSIDGHTVCSTDGVRQSFGGASASPELPDLDVLLRDDDLDAR